MLSQTRLSCSAVAKLDSTKAAAKANLWWPFTQHSNVQQDDVTVIDARCGEQYAVYQPAGPNQTAQLQLQYDACASWWTQVHRHACVLGCVLLYLSENLSCYTM